MNLRHKIFLISAIIIFSATKSYSFTSNDSVTLCGVQFQPQIEKEDNLNSMLKYIELGKKRGCDLIVFPEISVTQYFSSAREHVKQAELIPDGKSTEILTAAAKKNKLYVSWGIVEKGVHKQEIYITQVLSGPTGYIGKYRKTHLVPELEDSIFQKGTETPIFKTEFGKIAFAICYDRRFPELSRKYAIKGADILIIPSATTETFVDTFLLNARAYENSMWLLFVNQVGPQGSYYLSGGSRLIDPEGNNIVILDDKKAGMIIKELPLSAIKQRNSLLKQRRDDLY